MSDHISELIKTTADCIHHEFSINSCQSLNDLKAVLLSPLLDFAWVSPPPSFWWRVGTVRETRELSERLSETDWSCVRETEAETVGQQSGIHRGTRVPWRHGNTQGQLVVTDPQGEMLRCWRTESLDEAINRKTARRISDGHHKRRLTCVGMQGLSSRAHAFSVEALVGKSCKRMKVENEKEASSMGDTATDAGTIIQDSEDYG